MQGLRVQRNNTRASPNKTILKTPKEDLAQPATSELTTKINLKIRPNQYDSENASGKAWNIENKLSEWRKIISDKWILTHT